MAAATVPAIPPIVLERVGEPKVIDEASIDELQAIIKEYYDRWVSKEDEVYDVNYCVRLQDLQIQELEMEVSDMRGKFILPKLKKVHNFKLMGGEE
jgi:hypothetical protein